MKIETIDQMFDLRINTDSNNHETGILDNYHFDIEAKLKDGSLEVKALAELLEAMIHVRDEIKVMYKTLKEFGLS